MRECSVCGCELPNGHKRFCSKECRVLWIEEYGPPFSEPDPLVRQTLAPGKQFWKEFDEEMEARKARKGKHRGRTREVRQKAPTVDRRAHAPRRKEDPDGSPKAAPNYQFELTVRQVIPEPDADANTDQGSWNAGGGAFPHQITIDLDCGPQILPEIIQQLKQVLERHAE